MFPISFWSFGLVIYSSDFRTTLRGRDFDFHSMRFRFFLKSKFIVWWKFKAKKIINWYIERYIFPICSWSFGLVIRDSDFRAT